MVRQELQATGLLAFHPYFPIGSRVKVINAFTGDAIEVTIIRPAVVNPLPTGWIIDVSQSVALALNVSGGETVVVLPTAYVFPMPAQNPPPEPPVIVVQAPLPLPPPPPPPPEPEPEVPIDLSELIAARQAAEFARQTVVAEQGSNLTAQAASLDTLAGALAVQANALNALADRLANAMAVAR